MLQAQVKKEKQEPARKRARERRAQTKKKQPSLTEATLPELVNHVMATCKDDETAQQKLLHDLVNKVLVEAKEERRTRKDTEDPSKASENSAQDPGNPNKPTVAVNKDVEKAKKVESKAVDSQAASSKWKVQVDDARLAGVHYKDHSSLMEVGEGIVYTMRKREQFHRADDDYISRQRSISKRMRATLIDWMFEVGQEFVLKRETLHVAITLLDRYLSKVRDVSKKELQLVGVAALWLAAKTKEIYPPKAQDMTFATDGAYSIKQLLSMETKMLKTLDYSLDPITCHAWVNWYLHELFSFSHKSKKRVAQSRAQYQRKLVEDSENIPQNSPFKPRTDLGDSKTEIHRRKKVRLARCFSGTQHNPQASAPSRWVDTPKVPEKLFARVMEVVDTALLDIDSLCFLPSAVSAAAVMYILTEQTNFSSVQAIERVTMYNQAELQPCLEWMSFAFELNYNPAKHPRESFIQKHLPSEDWYGIQTHNAHSLPLFRRTAGSWDERHPACDTRTQTSDWSHSHLTAVEESRPSTLSAIPPTPESSSLAESIGASLGAVAESVEITSNSTNDSRPLHDDGHDLLGEKELLEHLQADESL